MNCLNRNDAEQKNRKPSLILTSMPFVVASITMLLLVIINITNYKFPQFPWYPPISWGAPKEIFIDPVIIFIFAWKGWVFLVPLLFGVFCKSSYKTLCYLFIFTSTGVGILETIFKFEHHSIPKYLIGVMTYLFIYGAIFLVAIILKKSLEKVLKLKTYCIAAK